MEKLGQFEVKKRASTVDAVSTDITVGKDETIKMTFPKDATGRVTVSIGGVDYSGEIVNGKVSIVIPNLPAGKYVAVITYEGDDKYLSSTTKTKFEVRKNSAPVSATGDYIEIGDDGTVTVNLPKDATGTVTITVDGRKYTLPVVDGKLKLLCLIIIKMATIMKLMGTLMKMQLMLSIVEMTNHYQLMQQVILF